MANWIGMSRSNYFRVRNVEEFKKFMEAFPTVDVYNDRPDEPTAFCLVAAEEGMWPSWRYTTEDQSIDDIEDAEFVDEVAQFIADDDVAVFITVGFEKARYGTGYAHAINNRGDFVEQNIDAIYELAKQKLGVLPSEAAY